MKNMKPRKYLRVKGQLHSFVSELGRFSKTSGWHYFVDLSSAHAPEVIHHNSYWAVTPYKNGAFSVGDILIYPDHVQVYGKKYRYAGLDIPSIGKVSAKKLYNEIVNAIAKYVVGTFLQKNHADGSFYLIDLNFKLVPKMVKDENKLKLITEDEALRSLINDINNGNMYVRLDTKHAPMIKNKGFTQTWKIEPDSIRGFFAINDDYILAYDVISKYNLAFENHYHGIALCDNGKYYISAKDLNEAILSAIVKYSLERFGVDTTRLSKLAISFESTG
jgi:hypothetical protein